MLLSYFTFVLAFNGLVRTKPVELDDYLRQESNTIIQFEIQTPNENIAKPSDKIEQANIKIQDHICRQVIDCIRRPVECSMKVESVSDEIKGQVTVIFRKMSHDQNPYYNNEQDFEYLLRKRLAKQGLKMSDFKVIQIGRYEAYLTLMGSASKKYHKQKAGEQTRFDFHNYGQFMKDACNQTTTQLTLGNEELKPVLKGCWTDIRSLDGSRGVRQYIYFSWEELFSHQSDGLSLTSTKTFDKALDAGRTTRIDDIFVNAQLEGRIQFAPVLATFVGTLMPSSTKWNEDFRLPESELYEETNDLVRNQLRKQIEDGDKDLRRMVMQSSITKISSTDNKIKIAGNVRLLKEQLIEYDIEESDIEKRLNQAYEVGRKMHPDESIKDVLFSYSFHLDTTTKSATIEQLSTVLIPVIFGFLLFQ